MPHFTLLANCSQFSLQYNLLDLDKAGVSGAEPSRCGFRGGFSSSAARTKAANGLPYVQPVSRLNLIPFQITLKLLLIPFTACDVVVFVHAHCIMGRFLYRFLSTFKHSTCQLSSRMTDRIELYH